MGEAIRAVQWKWGDTFTGEALRHTYQTMVRRKGKSRKRAIVVITDGDPQDSKKIPKIVKSLKMKNTAIFAVGIGKASRNELLVVADGNEDFVFYADNYKSAQLFENRLVRYICKATGFG